MKYTQDINSKTLILREIIKSIWVLKFSCLLSQSPMCCFEQGQEIGRVDKGKNIL